MTGNGDGDLELVAGYLLAEDPQGRRFAAALRRTIDMLLDGQHTGGTADIMVTLPGSAWTARIGYSRHPSDPPEMAPLLPAI